MVLHNPNNWHWVNKDVREWAREYLEKSLVGTSAEEGGCLSESIKNHERGRRLRREPAEGQSHYAVRYQARDGIRR